MKNGTANDREARAMDALLILWISAYALLVLLGALVYIVVDVAVRALFLLLAVAILGCSWLANQTNRIVMDRATHVDGSPPLG